MVINRTGAAKRSVHVRHQQQREGCPADPVLCRHIAVDDDDDNNNRDNDCLGHDNRINRGRRVPRAPRGALPPPPPLPATDLRSSLLLSGPDLSVNVPTHAPMNATDEPMSFVLLGRGRRDIVGDCAAPMVTSTAAAAAPNMVDGNADDIHC